MTITKNSYKFDTTRVSIEPIHNTESSHRIYQIDIDNVISWDIFRTSATREELKGLVEFITKFLDIE